MKVTIDISDREWWELTELAEQRGVKVADMVKIALTTPHTITQTDMIQALNKAGLPDADIAGRLNLTVGYVAQRRRWLGLKPNRRPALWGSDAA